MTTLFLILIAFVILTCIGLNNVSSRIGVPTLLAFLLLGLVFNVTGAWRTLPVYACILTVLSFLVFTALVKNIKARKVENVVGLEALDGD